MRHSSKFLSSSSVLLDVEDELGESGGPGLPPAGYLAASGGDCNPANMPAGKAEAGTECPAPAFPAGLVCGKGDHFSLYKL